MLEALDTSLQLRQRLAVTADTDAVVAVAVRPAQLAAQCCGEAVEVVDGRGDRERLGVTRSGIPERSPLREVAEEMLFATLELFPMA